MGIVCIALTREDPGVAGGQVQSLPAAYGQQVQSVTALGGTDTLDMRVAGKMADDHLSVGEGQVVIPLVFHYICGFVMDHLQSESIMLLDIRQRGGMGRAFSGVIAHVARADRCCLQIGGIGGFLDVGLVEGYGGVYGRQTAKDGHG